MRETKTTTLGGERKEESPQKNAGAPRAREGGEEVGSGEEKMEDGNVVAKDETGKKDADAPEKGS